MIAFQDIHAATGGSPFDPARRTVLLIHGAGMDHSMWALQSRALAHRGFSVLAVDLPGHGRSTGDALPTIPAIADRLAGFLGAAGASRAIVAGHSMGALAALELAARHPEQVERLVLVGAALAMPVHPDLVAAAAEDLPAAIAMITAWGFSTDASLGSSPSPGLSLTGAGRRLLERSRANVLHTDLEACNAYDGGDAAAARIDCPTLVVAGSADRMTSAAAGQRLADAISGGRCVVLEGAGHMLPAERPAQVLRAIQLG